MRIGEGRNRRSDDHGIDGEIEIQSLISSLSDHRVSHSIDAPADPAGEWWIDLNIDGVEFTVAWRVNQGFGLFVSEEKGFGDRPDEIFRDVKLAAKRLKQLAGRGSEELACGLMRLGELRKLINQPQTAIASRLRIGQAVVSRLENKNDAKLSTIRDYVGALGGSIVLVVRFDDFEAPIELPCSEESAGRKLRGEIAA